MSKIARFNGLTVEEINAMEEPMTIIAKTLKVKTIRVGTGGFNPNHGSTVPRPREYFEFTYEDEGDG